MDIRIHPFLFENKQKRILKEMVGIYTKKASFFHKNHATNLKSNMKKEAEAGGFEPPVRLPVRQFSKLVVSATHPNFLPLRFLADSNRRTRFCRPLTKPLIQGTNVSIFRLQPLFLDCECKGTTIF